MAGVRLQFVFMTGLLLTMLAAMTTSTTAIIEPEDLMEIADQGENGNALACFRRRYTYKVTKSDDEGNSCWDFVNVMSCWGRCDSHEIGDWRFPYKRSHHPVCQHDKVRLRPVHLRNCDRGALPGTDRHVVIEAVTCRCAICRSADTACEGLRYRGTRSKTIS